MFMLDIILNLDAEYDDPGEEIEHLNKLIKTSIRRRRHLEMQIASAGRSYAPEMAMELKDISITIRALRERMNQISAQLTASTASPEAEPGGTLPAILVLEEEPQLITLLMEVLRTLSTPADVVSFGDPMKAIVATQQRPVPLVIAEHPFHNESTLEFCLTVQRVSPRTDVALILHANEPGVMKHANARGMDVLFYPIKPKDFVPILNSALTPKH
jgi:CheY-like chemotaxis protein